MVSSKPEIQVVTPTTIDNVLKIENSNTSENVNGFIFFILRM